MARFFRVVEKKRGQRRTGSNLVGSLGEAVFFGSLFLLGTISLSALIINYLVKPDAGSYVLFAGRWLFMLLMGSCVALVGAGLFWTVLRVGTSAERRGALASRAADIDLVNEAVPRPRNYPGVPPFDGLSNSPGIELAYRLPPAETPVWRLLATTIFTLLWNFVICLMITVPVISAHIAGRHDWPLTLLLVPFWAVSYWSIRYFFQLLMLHTWMGHTTLEISDMPLAPGREYQVAIAQHGHVAMGSLQLWLVCEEEATFTQGTDIRTEVREVYRQLCYQRRDFRVEPAAPFRGECSVVVPLAAMHSFQSRHNAVRWRLVLHGAADGWPEFVRGFPVVVYPGESTMQIEVAGRSLQQAWQAPVTPAAPGVRA